VGGERSYHCAILLAQKRKKSTGKGIFRTEFPGYRIRKMLRFEIEIYGIRNI